MYRGWASGTVRIGDCGLRIPDQGLGILNCDINRRPSLPPQSAIGNPQLTGGIDPMKRRYDWLRKLTLVAAGGCMLQAGGCDLGTVNEFVQTVFLGISAAGAIAILQNI